MWSQYDENLSANPFFKEIQENHNDIIEESSVRHWIICIPRIGTIEPSEISSDIILDHVVLPTENDDGRYYTLSKKQIIVQNIHILTDSNGASHSVEILFKETFYNNSSRFIVWCVDKPLFLKHNFCNSHLSKNLSSLHDCIDFLWCESRGHNILDSLKKLVYKFICEHEFEVDLQAQKELIGILFSQCLQLCFKNESLRVKFMQNGPFLHNLKLAVETYMQYCLGRELVFSINTVNHQKDSYLNKIIKNGSTIQHQDLGIKNDLSNTILNAKFELNHINSYWTVLDKIECLKKTLNIIFESGNSFKTTYVTSDDVLQILVFLVLKLNVNNWYTNLSYMKEFQLSVDSSDQNMYCISSLEAAVEFIGSTKFWDIQNSVYKSLELGEETVNFIDTKIKSGEIKTLTNLTVVSESETNSVQGMCHPLCVCTKCQNIVQQQNSSFVPFTEMSQNVLISATCLGKFEVADFLISKGVNVNFTDCFGKTSLHYAASKGFQNILLLLINKQADVNLTDKEKNTPLHLASLNGQENCAKALIYSSPDIELNIRNSFGDTPLIIAARWGYLDIVKILLENGASIAIRNKRNQTVFDVALNLYIIKLCEKYNMKRKIANGNDLEFDNKSIISGYQDSCKNYGLHPKSPDQCKKIDLLLKSIENDDFPLTCFYLGYNNTADSVKNGDCHPLCVCEKCKNTQSDNLQEEKSFVTIKVNMCDANGYTPLHTSAQFGRTKILRLLLDSGALPNVKTFKFLYTPLHLACIHERIEIVRELLKCGDCNIDEQDVMGNTPINYACQNGNTKIADILLSNGADFNRKKCVDEVS